MDSDLFCEDYYIGADKKIVNLVEHLLAWKKSNHMLYSADVLNMMIDLNLISMVEVLQIIDSTGNKKLDITLPTSYIT